MAVREREAVLVTGYPGYIGKRLAARIAAGERNTDIYLLVQPKFLRDARRYASALPQGRGNHVHLLAGDILDLHLGLSGAEYRDLVGRLTQIFHLAAISYLGVDSATMARVNVEGTRNMLEVARDARVLKRMNHFSTCFVAGDRVGVISEDELDVGQRFHNPYEQTKFEAEKIVRGAMAGMPVTIYRPAVVIGDSQTGEIDRFEGPYYLAIKLAVSPLHVPLPLPPNADFPLNVVPVDFVVEATYVLAHDARAMGRTFHLVDPSPMSSRRLYEILAERTQRKVRRINVPAKTTGALMRLPGLERLLRGPRTTLEYGNQMVFYRCANALELLDGTGVRCPPPSDYLDTLIRFVRESANRRRDEKLEDPLDQAAAKDDKRSSGKEEL